MTLPQGWQKVKFGELAEERSDRVDNPSESGFDRYVGLEHLDSGSLVVKRWGSTKDVTSAMKLFKEGDILFARRNTYLRRVSVAQFDGVCSGDIIVLQPILKQIVKDFLPIFMQFEDFENRIISLSAGAFSKRIKWKQLAEENIHIPSNEEQKKIVDFIWTIQDQIRMINELIYLSEKIKRGLLNELLTKGISHTKFKKTEIGEIPVEWRLIQLKDHLKNIQYGYTASAKNEPVGPKFLRITDISSGKIDWDSVPFCECNKEDFERNKLKIGDIVFARTGATTGETALIRKDVGAVFASYLIKIEPDNSLFQEYLAQYLKSNIYWNQIKSFLSGSAQGGVNATSLGSLLVPLPELHEQKSIVKILEKIDWAIEEYQKKLELTSKLKKKLTDEFLSGKILLK